jgi:twinkle protein
MPVTPILASKLRHLLGSDADAFIEDAFRFISTDPHKRGDDPEMSLDWIIDRATDAVIRDGIRVLVIDPWNEIEHARTPHEPITDYVGRSIRVLKKFAQAYEVVVVVVAHPTKEVFVRGEFRPVGLYDIEGSAHWFNKPDAGIVISRSDDAPLRTTVTVAKVRFEQTGERGKVVLAYDRLTGRLDTLDGDGGG